MLLLVLYIFSIIICLVCGAIAVQSDVKGMIIPNKLSIIIFLVFLALAILLQLLGFTVMFPLASHLTAGSIMFVVTFLLFTAGVLGGGDAKLIAAYSFWFGIKGIAVFVFYTAVMGALVALLTVFLRYKKPFKQSPAGSWVARAQAGENVVPYAIAIFLGAAFSFYALGFFEPDKLMSFLEVSN